MYKNKIFRTLYGPLLFVIFVIVFIYLGLKVILPIGSAIAWSLLFAFLSYPFFRIFDKYVFRGKMKAASAVCALLIFLLICIIPLSCVITPLAAESQRFAGKIGELFTSITEQAVSGGTEIALTNLIPPAIQKYIPKTYLPRIAELVASMSAYLIGALSDLSKYLIARTAVLLSNFMIAFLFAFFIIRDAKHILAYIKKVLPLSPDEVEKFFGSTYNALNSVVYGSIISVFFEAACVAAGWWYIGKPEPVLCGIVAFFCGLCPAGTAIVWAPAAIYLFCCGEKTTAAAFFIWSMLSTGSVENIVRPLLIGLTGKGEHIPTLLILVGIIGGVFSFGFLGVFAGPIILVMLSSALDMYIERKKDQ